MEDNDTIVKVVNLVFNEVIIIMLIKKIRIEIFIFS